MDLAVRISPTGQESVRASQCRDLHSAIVARCFLVNDRSLQRIARAAKWLLLGGAAGALAAKTAH